MPSKQSTVRRLKTQPKPQLTADEVKRITEKLAVALEHDAEDIALMTLLFDHLQNTESRFLWSAIYTIKSHLFIGTDAMNNAQERFQANAYTNRDNLLLWPYEREAS